MLWRVTWTAPEKKGQIMGKLMKGGQLAGKKTYITAALGVAGAVAAYLTGDASLPDAFQIGLTAVLGATIRSGINGR